MLTPPAIATETIIASLRAYYGLEIQRVTFLPIGADAYAAVYRAEADDGTAYFLKLKSSGFDAIAVEVPAYLRAQGIAQVMAPLATTTGQLWASAHGYTWILYPFFVGENGFHIPLSAAQWATLGWTLRAVHSVTLPAALRACVPREDYSPRWRDIVAEFDRQVEQETFSDPIAARLATGWAAVQGEIRTMVERAATLAEILKHRDDPFVLCHTDLHAGNVLLSADDDQELVIVDWDAPILAPRERDLMFVGGGIGGIWDTPEEEARFYQGYGATEVDPVALSYYRYERIVEDLAAYGEQIFGAQGSVEDREDGLGKVLGQFDPKFVVGIAHATYERLLADLSPNPLP